MAPLRLGRPNRRSEHYPRFSEEEFNRRRGRVRDWMDDRNLEALVVYGDGGFHQAKLYYLTNYRPPFPTYLAFFADSDEEDTLFTGISNHLQYVREVSVTDDVRLMLPNPPVPVVERLREAGVDGGRIGLVGDDPRYNLLVPHHHYSTFEAELDADLVDVSAEYTRTISVAGEEELELVERAAGILDEMMAAFEEAVSPGVSERELYDVLEETAREHGAAVGSDFITSAPMEDPEQGEPITWHEPSSRRIEDGDVVTTEISSVVRGYMSQIHRPYVVGHEPNDTYAEMFDVVEEAYERAVDALQPGNTTRDVSEAMAPIEESPFKIYDVLAHGYGGAYRHPFIGIEESNYWPGADDPLTADWTFEPGNVVVVQPNAATPDERACLQFGTTVIVREDGPEVVHEYPAEFRRV